MTYIPDLDICTYGRHGEYPSHYEKVYPGCLAIGWLGEGNPYNQEGDLLPGFEEALRELVATQGTCMAWFGSHTCEFCEPPPKPKALTRAEWNDKYAGGKTWDERERYKPPPREPKHGNLIIHGNDGKVYAVPELLLHYVVDHGYVPPEEFQEAVCCLQTS